MNGLSSLFTYDSRQRYAEVRAYRMLTSSALVLVLLLCILGLIAVVGAFLVGMIPASMAQPVLLLLGSASLTLFLLFLFGVTYYPFKKPTIEVSELVTSKDTPVNVALAADFSLLRLFSPRLLGKEDIVERIFKKLLRTDSGKHISQRLQLDREDLIAAVSQSVIPSFSLEEFAMNALNITSVLQAPEVMPAHALAAFLLHPNLSKFLRDNHLRQEDISFMVWWEVSRIYTKEAKQRWWDERSLLAFTGIGLSWASGYTPLVDQLSRIPLGNLWDVPFGKEEQIDQLLNSLARRRQSNVLLVGQAGVGRLGVIKEVAHRINTNKAHESLNGQRMMYLHVGQLLSLASSVPEQIAFVSKALREMEQAGNIVAVLDGIGSILGGMEGEQVNISDILLPFLSSQTVRVIIVMSSEEYHLRIKTNEELIHLFDVVQVPEQSWEHTLQLLAVTSPMWESNATAYVPYQTLREIVVSTKSILPHIPFPEKAFDVLEEALVKAGSDKVKLVTPDMVDELISHKVGVDIGRLKNNERDYLLNLEDFIHRRVVNQKRGVMAVSRAMIRARAQVRNLDRPIGTFLFLGPTGVGKTETSKALAEAYFGSEDYLQRLDMSEFQSEDGVSRLIGDTKNPVGRLTALIADHPFCVLLLDEFEKADRSVQQLFLQVFDEGSLKDVIGKEYSFKHCIMIATSNAGAEFIRQHIDAKGIVPEDFDTQLRDHILQKDIFRPELLNRFDGVITFTPLSKEHIRTIAELMLKKLNKRLDATQGITVAITDELIDFLVSIGYNPEFGARPMNRAIQDTVEYAVAEEILRSQVEPGDKVVLTKEKLAKLVQ